MNQRIADMLSTATDHSMHIDDLINEIREDIDPGYDLDGRCVRNAILRSLDEIDADCCEFSGDVSI